MLYDQFHFGLVRTQLTTALAKAVQYEFEWPFRTLFRTVPLDQQGILALEVGCHWILWSNVTFGPTHVMVIWNLVEQRFHYNLDMTECSLVAFTETLADELNDGAYMSDHHSLTRNNTELSARELIVEIEKTPIPMTLR